MSDARSSTSSAGSRWSGRTRPSPPQAWRRRRPADLLKLVALAPGHALGRDAGDRDALAGQGSRERRQQPAPRALRPPPDPRRPLGGHRARPAHASARRLGRRGRVRGGGDRRAAPSGWAQAVALYRGDLSPEDRDVALAPGTPRAAPRPLRRGGAPARARRGATRGDAWSAIPLLRRVLDVDPATRGGAPARSCGSSRRLAAAPRRSASTTPARSRSGSPGAPRASEETRALRPAIQRGEVGPRSRSPRSTAPGAPRAACSATTEPSPVRGRAGRAAAHRVARRAAAPATLVLLGERGVGKTRLAVEGARSRRRAAQRCCAGPRRGGGAPYGLFADPFAEEARANPAVAEPVRRRGAGAAGVAGEAVRLRIFDAVRAALRARRRRAAHLPAGRRPARGGRVVAEPPPPPRAPRAGAPAHDRRHLQRGRRSTPARPSRWRSRTSTALASRAACACRASASPAPASRSRTSWASRRRRTTVAQLYRITDGSPFLTEEVVRAQRESGAEMPPTIPSAAIRAPRRAARPARRGAARRRGGGRPRASTSTSSGR